MEFRKYFTKEELSFIFKIADPRKITDIIEKRVAKDVANYIKLKEIIEMKHLEDKRKECCTILGIDKIFTELEQAVTRLEVYKELLEKQKYLSNSNNIQLKN
jgi:predicted metallopeptidase